MNVLLLLAERLYIYGFCLAISPLKHSELYILSCKNALFTVKNVELLGLYPIRNTVKRRFGYYHMWSSLQKKELIQYYFTSHSAHYGTIVTDGNRIRKDLIKCIQELFLYSIKSNTVHSMILKGLEHGTWHNHDDKHPALSGFTAGIFWCPGNVASKGSTISFRSGFCKMGINTPGIGQTSIRSSLLII